MFEEAGFLVYVQEVMREDPSHEWTQTINFWILGNINIAQAFSDDQIQCWQRFDFLKVTR